eukprot:GFKZ01003890.1.p1 GENE.GFKZ01003890.1~~GFKZ01003890.1.p1  ORF type:complete len:766 (+),score=97.61 GFKZ01003890.1:192-2489(+)
MPGPRDPTRIGRWELQNNILRPSRCLLQLHNKSLLNTIPDPITLHLTGHPPTTNPPSVSASPQASVILPRHLLIAAGGPLCALISPPFAESRQSSITIHETPSTFAYIHRFLTCQPLCLNNAPSELALAADRWQLTTLFDALFLHAEYRANPLKSLPPLHTGDLIIRFLPIMSVVPVPERFKRFLALRLALDLELVDTFFETRHRRADLDNSCDVNHDPGVACRRRKVDCSIPPHTAPDTTSEASTSDQPVPEVRIQDIGNDASASVANAGGIGESGATTGAPAAPPQEHSSDMLWNGAASSSATASGSASGAFPAEENEGRCQNPCQNGVPSVGDGNGQLNVQVGASVEASGVGGGVEATEQPATESDALEGTLTAGQVESSGAASQGSYLSYGQGSEGGQSNGAGGNWAMDGLEVEEDAGDGEDGIGKPCAPAPPYPTDVKEWHKEFDIWQVFLQQKMMRLFVHYLSNHGSRDYRVFLLDLLLGKLEPGIKDDEEVVDLLRQVDWFWEGATYEMLTSELTKGWTPRAWKMLALAQLQTDRKGVDVRMTWRYGRLRRDMLTRAAQLANKTDESDGISTHSTDEEEDLGFSVDWEERAGDQGFDFGMSLHCPDLDPNDMSPLTLNIRLLERMGEIFDKRAGRREVTTRIKVIESGCGCALEDGDEYQGFTASPTMNAAERVTELHLFQQRGCRFTIMEGEQLEEWMKKHKRQCGLIFQVRLYIFPGEEARRLTEGPQNSEPKPKCVCGFCEYDDGDGEDESGLSW